MSVTIKNVKVADVTGKPQDTMEVTFGAPIKGVGDSPYLGAADVRNLDIFNVPDLAQLNFAAANRVNNLGGLPAFFVRNNDSAQTVYALDANQVVSYATNADSYASWTAMTNAGKSTGHGNGLAIWKDYLVVMGDAKVDLYGPISNSPGWTNNWAPSGISITSLTFAGSHTCFTSVDDKLYICNGKLISSVAEATAPFAPATASSYTYNNSAITLPSQFIARCLVDLGVNLMIGTFVGNSPTAPIKIGRIYPYNRSSLTLSIPIIVDEAGVNQMISINNQVIFQAGTQGRYYITNGSTSKFLCRIPFYIRGANPLYTYPGAICLHKGRIFSGISGLGGTGSTNGQAVWSFNPDGTQLVLENIISTGVTDGNVNIGCLLSIGGNNDAYLIGFSDTTSSKIGIDAVGYSNYNYSTTYTSYFDTEIATVGTALENHTFTKLEYYLEKALAANEGIQVSYRLDSSSSFTTLGTYNFASEGAVRTNNKSIVITKAEQLQLRIALTGTTTTPKFKYLKLR